MTEELLTKIKNIPEGNEGFWKHSTEDTFVSVAKTLLNKGFTEEETLVTLDSLYWAVASEFGD